LQGFFMVGNPGETFSTVFDTVDFIMNCKGLNGGVSITIPFPGTELFETVEQNGHLKTKDWSQFTYGTEKALVRTDALDYGEVEQMLDLLTSATSSRRSNMPLWYGTLKKIVRKPLLAPFTVKHLLKYYWWKLTSPKNNI